MNKKELKSRYGELINIMKILSNELSLKLGKGFSRSNLQNMRLLYLAYPKSQTVSGKLGLSHYGTLINLKLGEHIPTQNYRQHLEDCSLV